MNEPINKQHLRLVFAKKEQIKYIAHLDLMLAWERALRRAQIPLAYSQGFNPRPKMQFASELPLGTMSNAEIIDIILNHHVDVETALANIRNALPAGLELHTVEEMALKTETLQHLLGQAEYAVVVETALSAEELTQRIANLLAKDEILQIRQRKRQTEQFNLRPFIHELSLQAMVKGDAHLFMRLTAGQTGNLRPIDLLKAMDLADNWASIERTRLIFKE